MMHLKLAGDGHCPITSVDGYANPYDAGNFFSGYIWINDSTSREAPSKISPNQDPGTQDLPS